MKVAIKDSNVFIDLELMGLLEPIRQLDIEIVTSAFVVQELEEGEHNTSLSYIRTGIIQVALISGEEMATSFAAFMEENQNQGLSATDLSVLFLAHREGAIVLTGDGLMRKYARTWGLEVRGTLWIMDQLVERSILEPDLAAGLLDTLMQRTGKDQRYLPPKEVAKRIEKWRP